MAAQDNEFAELEAEFEAAPKAKQGAMQTRVPAGSYKVMCAAVERQGETVLVDFEKVVAKNTGSKGFRLFFEILMPEKAGEEIVKGRIMEHTLWITARNLPYLKRDIATILGRDLKSLGELMSITWAGKTCEIVVADEEYKGETRSKIEFINPWRPEKKGQPPNKQRKNGEPSPASPSEDPVAF